MPLIWTFAFPRAEYWCPACGYTHGMLGAGIEVPKTEELLRVKAEYEAKSESFLDAKSTFACSELEYEGKRVKPADLPEDYKQKLRQIIANWKYEIE